MSSEVHRSDSMRCSDSASRSRRISSGTTEAMSAMNHSGELKPKMFTEPFASTPRCMKPLAALHTSS